jgi:hypothetical protein
MQPYHAAQSAPVRALLLFVLVASAFSVIGEGRLVACLESRTDRASAQAKGTMADPNTDLGLPLQSGFEGSAPVAYRIDDDGSLKFANAAYPAAAKFVDASKIALVKLRPRYLNAPAALFKGQDKFNSYVRLSVTQSGLQTPLTSQLSWNAFFPLNTDIHQDIPTRTIGADETATKALDGITIPNGAGELSLILYAVVGPPSKTAWTIIDSTYQKLRKVASQEAGTTLALPASALAVADQVDGLLGALVLALENSSKEQRWFTDDRPTTLQLNAAAGVGDGSALVLRDRIPTSFILVPEQSNKGDRKQLENAMASMGYPKLLFDTNDRVSYQDYLAPYISNGTTPGSFSLRINGDVAATGPDNPFVWVPYVTVELTATASSTSNQQS